MHPSARKNAASTGKPHRRRWKHHLIAVWKGRGAGPATVAPASMAATTSGRARIALNSPFPPLHAPVTMKDDN
jgi:hypothetical protein